MPDLPINPALIGVHVIITYLPDHSKPEEEHYTFAYTVTVSNGSDMQVQLLARHWLINDANDEVQEVRGQGVVGEQPLIPPGGAFRYTSGCTLATPVGYMEGSYTMSVIDKVDQGKEEQSTFEVPIPAFSLHTPTALN